MIIKEKANKIRDFYLKYENIFLPTSFFIGLFWDNFTLRRIDLLYENTVFMWSLFQCILFIILINAYDAGRLRGKIFNKIYYFFPMFLQFSFGNLFSGFIVFYVRSGSIFASWPFILFLAILFVANEFFRKRYTKLTLQVGIFFIAIFSYSIFALPVLINKMGPLIFLLSGLMALSIIGLIFLVFYLVMKERLKANLKPLLITIFSIYFTFQFLYFTNILPPVPLSVKEVGIYHSIAVNKADGHLYKLVFEPETNPLLFFKDQSDIYHIFLDSTVYCYSAIFSPSDLNTKIYHRWLYFDEDKGDWDEVARPSFRVIGGRGEGYRGYSFIRNITPGKWRVDVINERNQVFGIKIFKVVNSENTPTLETTYR